jgi:hypothetical protein
MATMLNDGAAREVEKDLRSAEYDATNALRQTLYAQEMSALRSLQVVNAGGAVALLSFLGQTWNAAPELRIALVGAICLMAVGLLLAVGGGFLLPTYFEWRYRQNETGRAGIKHREVRFRYYGSVTVSFSAFVFALALVLVQVAALS